MVARRKTKLLECLQLHHLGECRHLSISAHWQCSQNPFLRAVLPMEVEVSAQVVVADDKSTRNSSSKVSFSTKIMQGNNNYYIDISIYQYSYLFNTCIKYSLLTYWYIMISQLLRHTRAVFQLEITKNRSLFYPGTCKYGPSRDPWNMTQDMRT